MPGRRGWSNGLRDDTPAPGPSLADVAERRAAARAVAAASTGPDDLRELLAMLGLDTITRGDHDHPAPVSDPEPRT